MVGRTALTLLVAASLLLAGCAGTGGQPSTDATPATTDSTATDPTDSTTAASTTNDGHYRSYEFSAREVTRADIARDVALSRSDLEGYTTWGAESFAATLFERHAAEQVDIDEPNASSVGVLDDDTVIRSNGTYYAVEKSVVARHEGTAYEMKLEGPLRAEYHDEYDRAEREAVNFSSLSAADRAVFEYAVPPADERESAVHSVGYDYVFAESIDSENATLVDGDRQYVRYEGDLFRVESDGPAGPKVRYRVRYELSRIADSPEEFVQGRLSDLVTPLNDSNATAATRDIVVEAIEGRTVEWEGRSEAPARIREAASWAENHPPTGSDAYVRYGGALYRVRVGKLIE